MSFESFSSQISTFLRGQIIILIHVTRDALGVPERRVPNTIPSVNMMTVTSATGAMRACVARITEITRARKSTAETAEGRFSSEAHGAHGVRRHGLDVRERRVKDRLPGSIPPSCSGKCGHSFPFAIALFPELLLVISISVASAACIAAIDDLAVGVVRLRYVTPSTYCVLAARGARGVLPFLWRWWQPHRGTATKRPLQRVGRSAHP